MSRSPGDAREAAAAALQEALAADPHFVPHLEVALEETGKLGQGGMGVVYRVRDRRLGREAALKLMVPGRESETSTRRFRREVEVTARLDHPSVPPVYEAGTTRDGRLFLLMRLVEGDTLRARIKSFHASHPRLAQGARALRALLEALVKVGEAVAYAHSRRVVHRDLKPDTALLDLRRAAPGSRSAAQAEWPSEARPPRQRT
ncbi:MAG: protein kinase [Planctomycetota bacterium]